MHITSLVLLLVVLVKDSHQRSTLTSNSYVAAVVEFSPTEPTSLEDPPSRTNAARYVNFIEKAARRRIYHKLVYFKNGGTTLEENKFHHYVAFNFDKQDVDIIVFPEAGLTSVNVPERKHLDTWCTVVPSPSDDYNPCIHATIPVSETLKVISCAARDNMIYVVINLSEKVICINESCATDQRLYYNTNVVFDREGKIIARYRKANLFMEAGFNVTTIPEVVTFETDFGVTFGTFTCFDILFKKPAMYLTRILNVTDIVFPTAWFSEVPFLTALQTQAGWSYAEDANFLVSGYSRPKSGNAGSGIYLGRRGFVTVMLPNTATSNITIARVPKKNLSSSAYHRSRPRYEYNLEEATRPIEEREHEVYHDELRRKREAPSNESEEENRLSLFHDDLSSYKFYQFDSSVSRNVCHGEFCCHFNVQMSGNDRNDKYRMIVYEGTRRFLEPVTVGLGVCAVVLCSNESWSSCGNPERSEAVFDLLTISLTFANYENVLVIPSSIGPDLIPLLDWGYEERWEDGKLRVLASLAHPTKNIVTCGIYGRDFSRDSWANEADSKIATQWATLTALAIVSLFLLFLYRKGWRKPWQRNTGLSSEAGPYQHL